MKEIDLYVVNITPKSVLTIIPNKKMENKFEISDNVFKNCLSFSRILISYDVILSLKSIHQKINLIVISPYTSKNIDNGVKITKVWNKDSTI